MHLVTDLTLDAHPDVRRAALSVLALLRFQDALPLLRSTLRDTAENAESRCAAALGLGRFKDASSLQDLKKIYRDKTTGGNTWYILRCSAAVGLGTIDAEDALQTVQRDYDSVQHFAFIEGMVVLRYWVLHEHRNALASLSLLAKAVDNDNDDIRAEAALMLSTSNDRRAIQYLRPFQQSNRLEVRNQVNDLMLVLDFDVTH